MHTLLRNTSLLLILLVLASVGRLAAQSGRTSTGTAVESLIDIDGHIRPDAAIDGGVDISGWTMRLDPDGTPRFVRDATPEPETPYLGAAVPFDECWADGFGPNGIYGQVYAVAVKGSEIYLGGSFLIAGPILANNVVRYNFVSNTWSVLGDPTTNGVSGTVFALAVLDEDIYVGGRFISAGDVAAHGIARWNRPTNRWSVMGSGVASDVHNWPILVPYSGTVYAIAATSGSIYIGGAFEQVGGEFIENLARWDFNARKWTIPCRLEAEAPNGPVYALHVRDSNLYVGGTFTQVGPATVANICAVNTRDGSISALGTGTNGTVYAIGSNAGGVYIGGAFTQAGGTSASHIARWNGTSFSQLTSGLNANVRSIVTVGDVIYVGGTFQLAGGISTNCVAQWRNGEWRGMAEGMSNDSLPIVYALGAVGQRIVAGGRFNSAGTSNAFNVSGWDTVTAAWTALGETVRRNYNGADGPIFAIALHGNDLYIGGDFANAGGVAALRVARYNRLTERWSALGSGISGSGSFVRSLAVTPSGDLYVGGIFQQAGSVPARGIARWDGTDWNGLGTGVDGPTPYVFALEVVNDDIIAGGAFTTAGGITSPKIARWKPAGSTWEGIGGGITGDPTYSFVQTIAASGSTIYAGGLFTKAGATTVNYITKWDGTSWSALGGGASPGVNATVNAIEIIGDTTYVGGDFTTAGGAPAAYAAAWNGTTWTTLGTGLSGPVRSMVPNNNGGLIIGGEFERAGGVTSNFLATWTSTAGWGTFGIGANSPVRAIVPDADHLYIAGDFVRITSVRANHVAALDANGWSALGSDPSIGLNGKVLAIAVKGSDVYVGGLFRTTGGVATNGVARWDGERWATVGGGVGGTNPAVNAIAIGGDGNVYVGGTFTTAGGQAAAGIARWNGATWSTLGSGVALGTAPGVVNTIVADGNDLIVGGRFTEAGGSPAGGIAFWSGASNSWSIPAGGVTTHKGNPGEIFALSPFQGSIHIGGRFDKVGVTSVGNHAAYDRTTQVWSNNAPDTNVTSSMAIQGDALLVAANRLDTILGLNGLIQRIDRYHTIRRFSSGTWTTVDTGGGSVNTIWVSSRGDLFVGGLFGSIANALATSIARWDGRKWTGLGSGTFNVFTEVRPDTKDTVSFLATGEVWAIAATPAGDGIWTGGTFQIAGAKSSSYFGYFGLCGTLGVDAPTGADHSNAWLSAVLPNPASNHATIEFTLPLPGAVVLTVHSANGTEVARILDEHRPSGRGTATWNAHGLAAGAYYCRLTYSGRSEMLPLVVVR